MPQEFGKKGVISLYLQCSPYERALRYLEREVSEEAGLHAEAHLPKQPYDSLQAVASEMARLDLPGIEGMTARFLGNANRDGLGSVDAPAAISDATIIDVYQPYIESADEPWHVTCRSSNVLGLDALTASKPTAVLEAEAAEEAKGKKKVGGATPGWTGKRVVASTHDNSV